MIGRESRPPDLAAWGVEHKPGGFESFPLGSPGDRSLGGRTPRQADPRRAWSPLPGQRLSGSPEPARPTLSER